MEMMLRTHIPTYAGGLGILAGDLLRSAADMHIPAVGVTLVYRGSSFVQELKPDGTQEYTALEWRKSDQFTKMPHRITINLCGEEVVVGCWRFDIVGYTGFEVPVYLLDTDYYVNQQWMREITANLYTEDKKVRLLQELILGIGGVRMLKALGYSTIDCYHMNEGHAAFVPIELLSTMNDVAGVRKKCIFTTHTPIPEGHDIFEYDLAKECAESLLPKNLKSYAGEKNLHTTKLAMSLSHYVNAVSEKHAEVTSKMFPDKTLYFITNGVHHRTWTASTMQDLYNEHMPGWNDNPELLGQAVSKLPDDKLWRARQETKKTLIDFVNHRMHAHAADIGTETPQSDELFDTETLTIALARRPVTYKRPLLIYHDLNRLVRISAGRIQIIQSGKSHHGDEISSSIVQKILGISEKLKGVVRIIYLSNYSPKIARLLVAGADIWLNTPQRPLEASGTSGMKAAINGGLNFSVLDGWWIEGYRMAEQAGFTIGPAPHISTYKNDDEADSADLYDKLEHVIVPMYYERRTEWIARMKHAISLGAHFNTNRVLNQYAEAGEWK